MAKYAKLDEDEAVLFDTKNSYYAGIVRMALAERSISYTSQYVSLPKQEQLAPWYLRMNPAGLVPAFQAASGEIVNDSRNIVNWAYGTKESAAEREVLDKLYSEDPGSLAWLSGEKRIPLLKVMVNSPLIKIMLPKKIAKLQAENPDLHDVYKKRLEAMSKKHFSKSITQVQANLQSVVDWLEAKRQKGRGPWLLGSGFGRADAVAVAFLQWISRCNEYGAAPVEIPAGLLDFLERAKARPSYQQALGQYGEDAFVLTMIRKANGRAGCMLCSLALLAVGAGVFA